MFKEGLIYEQSVPRAVPWLQENQPAIGSANQKIEHLHFGSCRYQLTSLALILFLGDMRSAAGGTTHLIGRLENKHALEDHRVLEVEAMINSALRSAVSTEWMRIGCQANHDASDDLLMH